MKNSIEITPLKNLLEVLPEHYSPADRELIQRAYRMAKEAHRGQKRQSGEPYINHCLAVAIILADLSVPSEVVVAGILHDTVEDTNVTLDDIRRDFSETVSKLVNGVTKLTNLPRVSRGDQHAQKNKKSTKDELLARQSEARSRKQDLKSETLRKTFLAMGDDVRVVLIKLADRLHNMRTLHHTPEEKQRRIAKETLEIAKKACRPVFRAWPRGHAIGAASSGARESARAAR
jgi:GTP pyrophosphokinase